MNRPHWLYEDSPVNALMSEREFDTVTLTPGDAQAVLQYVGELLGMLGHFVMEDQRKAKQIAHLEANQWNGKT